MTAALAMKPALDLAWFDIGALSDIEPLAGRRVETPNGEIGVFRTDDDRVFAVNNACPHLGGPLTEGIVHGTSVTCPLHSLVINLETGETSDPADSACARTHPLKVEAGRILLGLAKG